jgi:hypothetical protein
VGEGRIVGNEAAKRKRMAVRSLQQASRERPAGAAALKGRGCRVKPLAALARSGPVRGFRAPPTKISKTTPCKGVDETGAGFYGFYEKDLTRRANHRHNGIIEDVWDGQRYPREVRAACSRSVSGSDSFG